MNILNPNNDNNYRKAKMELIAKELNERQDKLYRERKFAYSHGNYRNDGNGFKSIIGLGLAIAIVSFYTNTCTQYKIISNAIKSDSTKIVKDSLEYKLK